MCVYRTAHISTTPLISYELPHTYGAVITIEVYGCRSVLVVLCHQKSQQSPSRTSPSKRTVAEEAPPPKYVLENEPALWGVLEQAHASYHEGKEHLTVHSNLCLCVLLAVVAAMLYMCCGRVPGLSHFITPNTLHYTELM